MVSDGVVFDKRTTKRLIKILEMLRSEDLVKSDGKGLYCQYCKQFRTKSELELASHMSRCDTPIRYIFNRQSKKAGKFNTGDFRDGNSVQGGAPGLGRKK